jgi:hypothetical protein
MPVTREPWRAVYHTTHASFGITPSVKEASTFTVNLQNAYHNFAEDGYAVLATLVFHNVIDALRSIGCD